MVENEYYEELTHEEQELIEKLKTVKDRVEFLLKKYPGTRNSDLYLIILYLRYFTDLGKYIKFIPYEVIREYDGITETIRRVRQKIQSEGRYLPTDPSVLRRRRKLAEKYKKIIHKV